MGFLREEVPKEWLDLSQASDKDIAILEFEVVGISVAVSLWKSVMSISRVVIFIDNDDRVYSEVIRRQNRMVGCLMGRFFRTEEEVGCEVWLGQATSQSNPSQTQLTSRLRKFVRNCLAVVGQCGP